MLASFVFNTTASIQFGKGVLSRLGDLARARMGGRVLVVTGIDAMVHAIEAYASASANNTPLSRMLALVIALLGFFGGLVMSTIKRDRGVKDWGHTIAGHGGSIDRLDSGVISAPIFFHLLRF